MRPSRPFEVLKATVRQGWDVRLAELSPMTHGMDANASAYQGITDEGDAFFVKVRSTPAQGGELATELRESGVESAVGPIRTRDGGTEFEGVSLCPFVEGQNGFERTLTLEDWRTFGVAVRRIHDFRPIMALRKETFQVERTASFDRLARSVPNALREIWFRERERIERVRRRTEEVGDLCRTREWTLVPCHADLHVGNVLDGKEFWIVDWDGPRLAPRERDLMFVTKGGILGEHDEEEESAFFEGYGEVEMDPLALVYYRYAWALDDLAAYLQQTAEGDPKAPYWFERQFHPKGIVASAIRSDDRSAIL